MLFILPSFAIIGIYFAAAVLPAVFLMRYIYRKDKIEKEPSYLLWSLVLMGVLAAVISIAFEYIGQAILDVFVDQNSKYYTILLAFIVVAVVEEGAKFLLLKRRTWRDMNFNYRFDGIVYAVFVSLGFAAFENVKYVFGYGLSVAFPRAILAIPGHMGFAVFMGAFYGRAKLCEREGNMSGKRFNMIAGYLSAVLLHGFYDSCAMNGSVIATVLFVAFVAVMYFVVIGMIKKESNTDRRIY